MAPEKTTTVNNNVRKLVSARALGLLVLVIGILLFLLNQDDGHSDLTGETASKVGRLGMSSVGRGYALVLLNDQGQTIASCHSLKCGYKNDQNDHGKLAEFFMQGRTVVEIRVEGQTRIDLVQITNNDARKNVVFIAMAFVGAAIFVGGLFL